LKPPRRRERQFHIAALEVEGIVIDYIQGGLPDDPHREHTVGPVVQMLGARRFHLLDGVPVSSDIDIGDKVTLARDLVISVEEGKGRGRRGPTYYLACLPGYTDSGEKAMFCHVMKPEYVTGDALKYLENYLEMSKKAKYVIVSDAEELEEIASKQGLPRKIVSTPPDPITYDNLTPIARANLADAVKAVLREREDLFVIFFKIAEPINVRLHSVETLRGVGKKTLKRFLYERESKPIKSYSDVKNILKIDPVEALAEKILE
jgi:putative nucleotide binding protein